MLAQIWSTTWHLPPRIQAICWVQFWSWIGLLLLVCFSSVFHLTRSSGWFPFLFYGSTWVGETYFRYSAPIEAKESKDALGDIGRVGSLSLVVFSLISLSGSIAAPWLVRSPEDEKRGFTPRPHPRFATLVTKFEQYKPDLLTTWLVSHFIFSASMGLAPLVRSVQFATVLVAVCGM